MDATPARSRLLNAFGPMRRRSFAWLAVGQFTSGVGDGFYAVALPWLILTGGGGAAELGVVIACYGITRAAGLWAGGWLADRRGPAQIMMVSDTGRFVLTLALGIVVLRSHPGLPVLIPFALLHGTCGGAFTPASNSLMPSLVPEDELGSANSAYTLAVQISGLLGPAAGGAVVAVAGSGPAFVVDAASFAVSAGSLLMMRRRAVLGGEPENPDEPGRETEGDAASAASSVPEVSFRTVLRLGRLLHAFVLAAFLVNLFFAGTVEVALPDLAHQQFGSGGYGGILTALSAGAVLGAFFNRVPWAKGRPTLRVAGVTAIMGLALALLPFSGGVAGAAVCMAVIGAADTASGVDIVSMLQVWAPRAVLARVMSTIMFGVIGLFPVSVALAGLIVRGTGPKAFFPVAGGVTVLAVALLFVSPAFRSHRKGDRFMDTFKSGTATAAGATTAEGGEIAPVID